MKSELTERKVEEKIEFPKLMESRNGEIIVLFSDSDKGAVVHKRNSSSYIEQIGYYSKNWYMEDFIDYEGVLTLQN